MLMLKGERCHQDRFAYCTRTRQAEKRWNKGFTHWRNPQIERNLESRDLISSMTREKGYEPCVGWFISPLPHFHLLKFQTPPPLHFSFKKMSIIEVHHPVICV